MYKLLKREKQKIQDFVIEHNTVTDIDFWCTSLGTRNSEIILIDAVIPKPMSIAYNQIAYLIVREIKVPVKTLRHDQQEPFKSINEYKDAIREYLKEIIK